VVVDGIICVMSEFPQGDIKVYLCDETLIRSWVDNIIRFVMPFIAKYRRLIFIDDGTAQNCPKWQDEVPTALIEGARIPLALPQ
jgi:hypothetical protein